MFDRERIVDVGILLVISLFLLYFFKPSLMLSKTITAGGDTASHYYPALFMSEHLIPEGRATGWAQGWFAGFPIFRFYFPLSYMLMHLLSLFTGFQVAFKLVTVLGIFLLPVAAYAFMRFLKYDFPAPAIAAVFTLPFLFMTANSMWGGTIPSTLAGEFAYGISVAVSILFLGLIYSRKHYMVTGTLFSLVILTHAVTTIWAFFSSLALLALFRERKTLEYLFQTYVIAFLLSAFWFLPLLSSLGYTTPYGEDWAIELKTLLPSILQPVFLLSCVAAFAGRGDKRTTFLLSLSATALLLVIFAEKMGIVNIRFIPFFQVMFSLLAASVFSGIKKNRQVFAGVVAVSILAFTFSNASYIPGWIKWNYSGFEGKSLWNEFKGINEFLKGDASMPRVVYEHSDFHDKAGSVRAFESLPLFSGRSTLEGLFMQSSLSSPFVFYIQSEISDQQSCPFWRMFPCTSFNLDRGIKHLRLFNVGQYIVTSKKAREAAEAQLKLLNKTESYEIFSIEPTGYVTVPEYYPAIAPKKGWKKTSYNWFRFSDLDVPIIFEDTAVAGTEKIENETSPPRNPLNNACVIREKVMDEEIRFETTCPGKPHIIKITYNPSWVSDNGEKIYLSTPSFMLIYPEKKSSVIRFKQTSLESLSSIMTVIGLMALAYESLRRIRSMKRP
ncbi:MAG: hypothetical protein HZB68_04160 [Candidatus Aenigmarchaeota archaeon]|nr:hypothetical protein [Candidatus Aenigmarchaeota archaeon]